MLGRQVPTDTSYERGVPNDHSHLTREVTPEVNAACQLYDVVVFVDQIATPFFVAQQPTQLLAKQPLPHPSSESSVLPLPHPASVQSR